MFRVKHKTCCTCRKIFHKKNMYEVGLRDYWGRLTQSTQWEFVCDNCFNVYEVIVGGVGFENTALLLHVRLEGNCAMLSAMFVKTHNLEHCVIKGAHDA